MVPESPSDADKWRFQVLAKSLSLELQRRRGRKEYYSPEDVAEVCDSLGLPKSDRVYAVAMFVAPSESEGILRKLGSAKTTREVRKFLAGQMICGTAGSVDYDYHGFHDTSPYAADTLDSSSHAGFGGDGTSGEAGCCGD